MRLDPNADKYLKGILGKTGDDIYQVPRLDPGHHAQIVMGASHQEVHAGHYFTTHHTLTGKNDGTWLTIYLLTPNSNKEINMWAQWTSSGAAYFRIREYPVVTANTGTTGPTFNQHRKAPIPISEVWDNTAVRIQGSIMTDVTIPNRAAATRGVNGGLIIWEEFDGIGKQVVGESRDTRHRVLEKNMAYVFEVESDAAALILSLQLEWYEHLPKGE